MKNPNFYTYRPHDAIDSDEEGNDFGDNEENPDEGFKGNGNLMIYEESRRHLKKRKLESFVSNYELGSRREIWSEEESFLLLEAWGERFLELGRRSLRGEDWAEISEKVSEMGGGVGRTEGDCRNQLDVFKNKYKKEMAKVESGHGSKWVYFKKMDALLSNRTRGAYCGLDCGVDSGEYVFMNPQVYLERSNLLDEMRDSPGQSDEDNDGGGGGEEEEEDDDYDGESTRLLAESIQKFGEMYEKIEKSKRKQMMELETMRQDIQRELEMQKKQIVECAQAEIAKIREIDDDEEGEDEDDKTDTYVENLRD